MGKKTIFLLSILVIPLLGHTQSVSQDLTWNTTSPIKFSEDFAIFPDTINKWYSRYSWGYVNNGLEYNLPSNLAVVSGMLRVKSTNVPYSNKPFTGGAIHSRQSYKFGYYETRMRLPKGKGFFPAFWLFGASCWPGAEYYNEIDIMEMYGNYSGVTTNIHSSYHWLLNPFDTCKNRGTQTDELATGTDLSFSFNKYAVEWMPNYMIFFFNDVPYHINFDPTKTPKNNMHIIANLAIHDDTSPGKSGTGIINSPPSIYEPDNTTPFPKYLDVDWIKAYDSKKDYSTPLSICTFVKASYNFKVYQSLTFGGGCTTTLNTSDNLTFRARDEITIQSNTTIQSSGTGHVTFLVTGTE